MTVTTVYEEDMDIWQLGTYLGSLGSDKYRGTNLGTV
jgi:hypothetical protein